MTTINEHSAEYALSDLQPVIASAHSARGNLTDSLPIWLSAQTRKSAGRGRSADNTLQYGVQKLRELILELAVRGKLVPQDPNDEPASLLLEKIAEEKARLVKEGKIKKPRKLASPSQSEIPYSLPDGWEWTQIESIGHDWGQKTPKEDFTYIDVASIDNLRGLISNPTVLSSSDAPSRARKIVKPNTIIYSTIRPYLQNIAVVLEDIDPKPIASTAFAVIHPMLGMSARYFLHYFRSPVFVKYVESVQAGIAYPAINDKQFFAGFVPVPPLAEQHRIVKKVDEMMALCDRLEQQQADAVQAHDTLVKVLLDTLTQSENAEDFQQNWHRIAGHFDTLFTTESSIDQLKQTLLQLAVMGKLVPQDPNDEPAGVLLEKIAEEKAQLVKEGKIKKQKPQPKVTESEILFHLPHKWSWSRLSEYSTDVHYGYTTSADHNDATVRLLRITDIQDNKVNWETVPGCQIEDKTIPSYKLNNGDILIARTGGTIGKSYLVENLNVTSVFASYLIRIRKINHAYPEFIKLFLGSKSYWDQLYASSMGTGQPNVNGNSLKRLVFPLPPLAEQHRIVKKVDQLMALCDQLKDRIYQAQTLQQQLADAVVKTTI